MLEEMCSSMKIIVVGNGKVGKTTLTIKYVKGKFTTEYKIEKKEITMYVTEEFVQLTFKINIMNCKDFTLELTKKKDDLNYLLIVVLLLFFVFYFCF